MKNIIIRTEFIYIGNYINGRYKIGWGSRKEG